MGMFEARPMGLAFLRVPEAVSEKSVWFARGRSVSYQQLNFP